VSRTSGWQAPSRTRPNRVCAGVPRASAGQESVLLHIALATRVAGGTERNRPRGKDLSDVNQFTRNEQIRCSPVSMCWRPASALRAPLFVVATDFVQQE